MSDTNNTFTKAQLIELATTHFDLSIRQSAAQSIYSLGRADGASEMREAYEYAHLSAKPYTGEAK